MPNDDIVQDSDTVTPLEIQRKSCNDEKYKLFPDPCLSCVFLAKNINIGPCRFRNIRAFKRQPNSKQLVYGPFFATNKTRRFHVKVPPTMALPSMTKEQRVHIQESIRPAMKKLLERDWKVMKLNEKRLRRRPPSMNSRHTCDHCYTNIFNVHYMCTLCGVDVCLDCFDLDLEWTMDSTDHNFINEDSDDDDNQNDNGLKYSLASCTLGRQHTKAHFIPITKHSMTNIELLRLHTSLHIPVLRPPSTLVHDANPSPTSISTPPSPQSSRSSVLSVASLLSTETQTCEKTVTPPSQLLPSTPLSSSPPIEHHTAYPSYMDDDDQLLVASWKDITLDRFQQYWRNGKPAMIQDTMERSQIAWTPEFFCSKYGNQWIDAIDCHTTKVTKMTINDFFKQYMETNYQSRVLKIKDWPPGADFKTKCPLMYKDFMAMLPVPEYCAASGVYNLSNRLPDLYIKPDLGPKMFIAYGLDPTDAACQVGTTNLHCDMTDAVNVMCHAQKTQHYDMNDNNKRYDIGVSSSPGKAAAVWDIFSFNDLPYLRLFVGELLKEKAEQSPSMSKKISKLDPIHSQWIYLTEQHLRQLKIKYNVEPWRLYQNPGDAIYIPAGCAHQVANCCNAIKCAYDFVSPENIDRSSAITQQFGRAKQEDVLQLKTTLLYTWVSVYKASQDIYPSSPVDDESLCFSPYHTHGTCEVVGKKRKRGKHGTYEKSKKCEGNGNHECSPTDDL